MRCVVGVLLVSVAVCGCAGRHTIGEGVFGSRPAELAAIQKRRDEARTARTTSTVGLAVGVVASVVGIALLSHGSDVRGRESSADDEDGLGALLGGFLLTGAGVATTIGSGVGLVLSGRRLDEANRDLDRTLRSQGLHLAP
jgi:hypothetical protein